MIEKKIVVHLKKGLQDRNATEFVHKASSFNSDIKLMKHGRWVVAKSIMGVMTLAVKNGEKITLSVDGMDKQEALTCLEEFLSRK